MSALRALCFVGMHPLREWAFVGTSWTPDAYIRVCRECGRQVYQPPKGCERCKEEQ